MNQTRVTLLASFAICAHVSTACVPPGVIPTLPATGVPVFSVQPQERPTVSAGRAGWPLMSVDPNIYVDDEGYHLFYSTLFCQTGNGWLYSWDPANPTASCNIMKTMTSIAYAFSTDRGLTWTFRRTPVVIPSETGFDAGRIETASFFRLRDTVYIAYSADGMSADRFSGRYQIGLATLPLQGRSVRAALLDGTRYFDKRANPLLAFDLREGRFDNNVQEPSVVVTPDGIELFFIGLGLKLPREPLGVPGQNITSVGLGRAKFDNRLNVISRSESMVLGGVNSTEVRFAGGQYHLFATTLVGGQSHENEAISYATSPDGTRWTRPRTILSRGGVAAFNDWGLTSPTAAFEPDQIVLFYSAFGTTQGDCQLVGANGRFGLPLPAESRCLYATTGRAVAQRIR